MAKKAIALDDMSIARLKKLLAARENVEALKSRRAAILAELAKLDREIGRLEASWAGKPGRPTATKTAPRKAGMKAAGPARPKNGRRKAARAPKGRVARAGKPTIEDVVVLVLGKRQMPFPDLLAKIQKDKLVATKSKTSRTC